MYAPNSHPSPRRETVASPVRQGTKTSSGHSTSSLQSAIENSRMSPGRIRKSSRSSSSSGSNNRADNEAIKDYGQQSSGMSRSLLSSAVMFSSGSSASLSPYHASSNVVTNSLVSVGSKTRSLSLLVDRSTDYNGSRKRGSLDHRALNQTATGSLTYDRDQSLDRHVDRRHHGRKDDAHYHTISGYGRERSSEREYPHMGARSLEREHQMHAGNSFRSHSIERGDFSQNSSTFYQTSPEMQHSRDGFILDLQSQVAELNKECAILQQELDMTKDKLSSTMNSIKTFWSPELKKERALRKDENSRHSVLIEQLRIAEIENRQHLNTLVQLEQENRSLRDLNLSTGSTTIAGSSTGSGHESDVLRKEKERHAKELKLLRKTVEEMELRIETQKQTMATRDESIKKLMDMLQAKSRQTEDERVMSDEARHIRQLEQLLEQKDSEMDRLREDSQIKNLENELKKAQDDLSRLSNAHQSCKEQSEISRSQEKQLKEKLENARTDLARKEAEANSLKTHVETLQKHWEDHERHIVVLRDQISTKEEQTNMLQSDLDMLRDRLKEKDDTAEKRSKLLAATQAEKKRLDEELNSTKDKLETANQRISSMQRKIDSLEEQIKEKDMQVSSTKAKLASLQADHSSSGTALSSLEELLADKDQQIEKLKEQRERMSQQFEDEIKTMSKKSSELKGKVESLQNEICEKQQVEVDLKEELSRLKSEKHSKESLISRLELTISEKTDQLSNLQAQLRKTNEQMEESVSSAVAEGERKLFAMKGDFERCKADVSYARAEVERFMGAMKEVEREREQKDAQIKELQTQLDENKEKLLTMALRQQSQTNEDGQPKSPDNGIDDAMVFKSIMQEKDGRITELEEALRESIKITAQREVVMAEQQMKLDHTHRLMESMQEEMEGLKKAIDDSREQLVKTRQELTNKEDALSQLQGDSKRQLSEVYEMKQEAILAAISEKDAHIALLEMAPNKKTENIEEVEKLTREKLKLQQVLKDLTQSRMKLLQNRGHLRSSSASSLLHYATHRDEFNNQDTTKSGQ